ncbi:MAG TPA: LuxR C-terminal-related transcriptional regulator [Amycolatopsis sp.]|jgi:DNA-binding NarL/FixJ family response regulator|nr:LuxR C-terminal-related transcriptional regulator [Amycolatopsis sp.]
MVSAVAGGDPLSSALAAIDEAIAHHQAAVDLLRRARSSLAEFAEPRPDAKPVTATMPDADAVALYARLTRRQQEVLAALCRGASNRDIAAALAISERTVKVHLNALFTKLGVGNRRAAIAVARQFDPLRTPDTPQQCFVTSPRRGPNGPRTNLGLGRSTQRRMHG